MIFLKAFTDSSLYMQKYVIKKCSLKYLKVTDLETIVEKLSQEMENMKLQLNEERQARQRLEVKISSLKGN